VTDDGSFERELRAMLARRDPGPGRGNLADRVRAEIARAPRSGRLNLIGRAAAAGAAMLAAATVLLVVVVVTRPIGTGPGSSPGPAPVAPYVLRAGDGLVDGDHPPIVQAIAVLLAVLGLILVVREVPNRWYRVAAAVGMLVLGLAVSTVGRSDALQFVDGFFGVQPAGNASPDSSGMVVGVTGDAAFSVRLTVTNTTGLPLEIEGLQPGPTLEIDGSSQPRLVGLGLLPASADPAEVRMFEPTSVPAGGRAELEILGMAGACAAPDLVQNGGRFASFEEIEIVYEQLTIWHTASIRLPEAVVIPESGATCP
jgi:hypothetical protein